jgi:aminopeptidase YwaD
MDAARLAPAALLLLAAASLAGDPKPLPPEPAPAEAFTAAEFLHDAAWLSADARGGRDTASPGGREAAAWIAARFKSLGLRNFEGAPDHLHPWNYRSAPDPAACSLAVVRGKEAPAAFPLGTGFTVLGGSAAGSVDAPAVFAGYGIRAPDKKYDDYAGIDAKGKVVVAFRHEPREKDPASRWDGDRASRHSWYFTKVEAARAAGAVAVVFVNDPLHHEADSLEGGMVGGPREAAIPVLLASRAFAAAVLAGSGKDAPSIQKAIDDADAPVPVDVGEVRVRLSVALRGETADNVAGFLPGSDPKAKDEWVVVGAHYDHVGTGQGAGLDPRRWGEVHNGADDNASGVAALLEIARHFALGKAPVRRSLLFVAFSGEEKGLLGSRAFVAKPPVPPASMVAMINLDMVGRYGPGRLEVVAAGTGSTLKETVDRAAEGLGLEYRHTNEGLSSSDGLSFYQAKVPTLFLFTGLHGQYHRPDDDWEALNAEGGAKVAEFAARIARSLADAEGRPAHVVVAPEPVGGRRRNRALLGVALVDAPDGKGAILDAVTPGSPAANADLRQGDRIVSFAGKEVKSSADLRAAVDSVRPGDAALAKAVRGEATIEVTVRFPGPPGPVLGVTFSAEGGGGRGVAILDVARGGVAEAAGVKAGDRLLSFGGKPVADAASAGALLRTSKAGDTIPFVVLREGKEIPLEAKYPK